MATEMTSLYATIAPHFTQDLLSPGLQVGYVDDGGVWQFIAPSLSLRLPLRAIEWKNLVGVTQTIDRLPLHFVNDGNSSSGSTAGAPPLICVYVIKCEDMDRYKSTLKAQIAHWIDRMNAARIDWMLLYVPLGTRTKRGSVSGGGSTTGGSATGIYKKIFERIKADFGNKKNASLSGASGGNATSGGAQGSGASSSSGGSANESARSGGVSMSGLSNLGSSLAGTIGGGGGAHGVSVDRICKIDTLEGASVVGTQATNETQWTELLLKMRKCIMEAFECKCWQYEEEVRVLDAKRSLPSWDFGAFFVAKERLALMYQQTCLLDDAIRHLDEMDAIFQFLVENDKRFQASSSSTPGARPAVKATDPIFTVSALAINMAAMHRQIASGQAPPLLMRLYFFSRQIRTLYLKGDFRQLIQRATLFISTFHTLLLREQEQFRGDLEWFQPHLWAVGACLEIAYACELSWSGHDYQISSASIPEGVSFALTPETMAGLLGDILYLARRVLKKSSHANGWWTMEASASETTTVESEPSQAFASSASSVSSWYSSLQSIFTAPSPDPFQRCVWELSHLASLHFSRAGRHRFAVFLGSECARYHFSHREFESASRLFRSHARQCEEDKWWTLVSDSVRRICDSELALGRSAQAVAACFSMLEIAQASRAEVSRDYLDQLLTNLVQSLDPSDPDDTDASAGDPPPPQRVKMGELIKPAMVIETMQSPESDLDYGDVRVTLSLANQFPAGIHIECVRIRFSACDDDKFSIQGQDDSFVLHDVVLTDDPTPPYPDAETDSLVELQEHNVYLYERASVNLIFLYGDVDVGAYKCTGLECTVAGNSFALFSRDELDAIRFEIPPRKSTLRLEINGPPLLTPASMEEIHITIDSEDDVVNQGVLEIALPDDCTIVSISHAQLHADQDKTPSPPPAGGQLVTKLTVDMVNLPPKASVTYSVWLVVGDDVAAVVEGDDSPLEDAAPPPVAALAASLRYDAGATPAKRHTELRRSERVFQVARPLSETVRLKRVDAARVFVAVALTCNPDCGVRIRDYALDCTTVGSEEHTLNSGEGEKERTATAAVRVVQDANAHVRGHRLGRSETLHMVFGLQLDAEEDPGEPATLPLPRHVALRVGVEFDGDEHARTWRTTSHFDLPLASVDGAVFQIDVRPKTASPPGGWSAGEDVAFAVTVTRANGNRDASPAPLLLCLAATSEGDWILLGKQRERFCGERFATTKRLLPLRVGRLRAPQFTLRAADGDIEIPSARVFCGQLATTFLVV